MKNKKQSSSMPKLVMDVTLIIMIVMLFGTTGYLLAKHYHRICSPNLSTSKKIIDNWKTYTDEKYEFEIRYPENIIPVVSYKENAGQKEVQQKIDFKIDNNSKILILLWNIKAVQKEERKEESFDKILVDSNYGLQSKNKKDHSIKTYLYSQLYVYQIEYIGTNNKENINLYNKMIKTFKTNVNDVTEENILNSNHKIKKLKDNQISDPKIIQLKNSAMDISEFIGNESTVFEAYAEDIDNDSIEEIFIYYMQDRESGISKGDKNKFLMILKNNSENNYEISWKHFVGDGKYSPQEKLVDWVTLYDDEADEIKIKFKIDYRPAANEPYEHRFVSFDKNENKFKLIKISNTDFYMTDLDMIRKAITVEDIDNNGIQEIIENDENEFGYKYVYNWDEKTYTYQANTHLLKDRFKLDRSEKIYTNEKYGYELKYVAYLGIPYDKNEKINLSYGHGHISITTPIEIEQEGINGYRCIDGEKTKTEYILHGRHVYITCSKIESENELEIFKSSYRASTDSHATYNLIKENNDETFTIVVVSATNLNADKIVSSFKFLK